MHETGELERLPRRHHIAVHHVQRITGLPDVQAGERAPSASDRVEGAPLALFEQPGVLKRRPHDLFRLLERLRRNVLQRQPAQRQRQTGLDALPLDIGQFERAAAEIANDAVGLVEPRHHTERRQLRFALAREDVDLDAANLFGIGDESLAVLRLSTRRGRDHP